METREEYYRNNCDICNRRFECNKVKEYDDTKDLSIIEDCQWFDDVYSQ